MSNENHEAIKETIEDIVRDMRIGDIRATANTSSAVERRAFKYINDFLAGYADRIEAAANREREAGAEAAQICGEIGEVIGREATREKSSRVGDAAKMREALERIASMGEQIDHQLGSSEETVYAFRHERCIAHNISEFAREALSATPRNCDLFATPKEAGEAFMSQACENPCGNCTVSDEYNNALIHECGIKWLFAEAKGERATNG